MVTLQDAHAKNGGGIARRFWPSVAAIVIGATALQGQQRPNFSGRWNSGVLEKPYSFTGEANRPDSQLQVGLGATRLVIRQGEKSIEIEENAADGPNTLVYRPDGAAVNNRLRLLLGKTRINSQGTAIAVEDRIPAEYVTKWKSDQLISAITVAVPGEKESRHYEETISLGVDGNLGIRIQRVGTGDSRTLYYKKDQGAQLAFASRR